MIFGYMIIMFVMNMRNIEGNTMKHKYRIKKTIKAVFKKYVCNDIWYKLSKEQIIERLMYERKKVIL